MPGRHIFACLSFLYRVYRALSRLFRLFHAEKEGPFLAKQGLEGDKARQCPSAVQKNNIVYLHELVYVTQVEVGILYVGDCQKNW